jgi:photosystem II stability/assembly factor-like uncharacterized protein
VITAQYLADNGVSAAVPFTFATVSYGLSGSSPLSFSLSGISLSTTQSVYINGISAAFTIANQSQLSVIIPATSEPSVGNVTIYNTSGVSLNLVNYFEFTPFFGLSRPGLNNNSGHSLGAYVTVADNGTTYHFTQYSYGLFIRGTDYGAYATQTNISEPPGNTSLSWTKNYRRPVCERTLGQVVLVPVAGGNYWYSLNAGNTWLSSTVSLNLNMFATSPNGSYVLAGTNGAGIYYGANISTGNIAFTQSPNFTTLSVTDMAVDDAGNCLAVVSGMSVYRSTNGGAAWSQPTGSPVEQWSACAVANGGYMYICGKFGSLYRSTDYGATWTAVANTTGQLWNTVACDKTGRYVIASTNNIGFFVSYDYGVTFKQRSVSGVLQSPPTYIGIATDANYFLANSGSSAMSAMRSRFTG